MIQRLYCRSCQGTYLTADRHNTPYYHVCPPLSAPEWQLLPQRDQARLKPGDERDSKRNENIALDAQGRSIGIISIGNGIRVIRNM